MGYRYSLLVCFVCGEVYQSITIVSSKTNKFIYLYILLHIAPGFGGNFKCVPPRHRSCCFDLIGLFTSFPSLLGFVLSVCLFKTGILAVGLVYAGVFGHVVKSGGV